MNDTFVDRALGSNIDYIQYAVPVFFVLIVVELVVARLRGMRLYRFNDSITDISCGTLEQLSKLFLRTLLLVGYVFVYNHARLFEIESWTPEGKWAAAVMLFVGVDFCFYWFHRFAHEWAAPWAAHVVHHQSEEFNLAVALRQSTIEDVFAAFFYLPLAVLGFPPLWFVAVLSLNLLYQFWIHTRTLGRLGPLEWVLNTPSHHRVHHGRNLKYLDKNYAGMLIIWDRMFGTFQPEEEEPVYGITKPIESWNPLWANLHVWGELAHDCFRAPRWRDKIKIWFMPLGWTPPGVEPRPRAKDVTRETAVYYDTKAPLGLKLYVLVQFGLAVALGSALDEMAKHQIGPAQLIGPAAMVVLSLVNLGGLLERKRWIFVTEPARLILLAAGGVWYARAGGYGMSVTIASLSFVAVSIIWLAAYRHVFTVSMSSIAASITPARESAASQV